MLCGALVSCGTSCSAYLRRVSEQCAIVAFLRSSFDVSVHSSPILSALPFLHSRWHPALPFLCLKVAALLIIQCCQRSLFCHLSLSTLPFQAEALLAQVRAAAGNRARLRSRSKRCHILTYCHSPPPSPLPPLTCVGGGSPGEGASCSEAQGTRRAALQEQVV